MRTTGGKKRFVAAAIAALLMLSVLLGTAFAEGTADPYAWMGLTEIPKCHYLDIIAGNCYYRTYDYYVMTFCTEQSEAVDGINSFQDGAGQKSYSVDGMILSVNDSAKIYVKQDLTSLAEMARQNMEQAIREGINTTGRSFNGTGKGSIPLYSDKGDETEYEYYEFQTSPSGNETDISLTERFYMKDGDVFAIYKNTALGGSGMETVEVIKSITAEIPDGLFDFPDLSGYSELGA